MARSTVVFDACVLYPAPLRDLLMELALSDLFHAKWTEQIHDEWIGALLETRPELEQALARTRHLMNVHVRDCLVENYEDLIESVQLPDPDDRHVVAAAIRAGADTIVTKNLRDFSREELAKYDLEAQHPDDFLVNQFTLTPPQFLAAVKRCRGRLKNPPKTAAEYLSTLAAQELLRTELLLRAYADVI